MVSDQSNGQPWRYRFILVPGMIACFVMTGASIYYYIQGSCGIVECMDLDHTPLLKKITLTLLALGMLAKGVEGIFIRLRRSGRSS